MRTSAILLIFILKSIPAQADILFVNTNFSEDEVAAARQAADQRGEKLITIPDLSQVPAEELEKIRALQKLETDWHRRKILETNSKPMVTKSTDTQLLKDLGIVQAKYGVSIEDISNQLGKSKDVNITTLLAPGHSDGTEIEGMLSRGPIRIAELKDTLLKTQTAPDLRSVYILGCNSLTPGRAIVWEQWKKDFPGLEVYGFDIRSPLCNKTEAAVVKSLLTHEEELRKEKDKQQLLQSALKIVGQDHSKMGISVLVNSTYISSDKNRADCISDLNTGCVNKLTSLDSLAQSDFNPYFDSDQILKKDLPGSYNEGSGLRKFYERVQTEFSACLDHCNQADSKGALSLTKAMKAQLTEDGVAEDQLPCPSDIIKLIDHEPIFHNFLRHYADLISQSGLALKNDPKMSKLFNDTFVSPRSVQPRAVAEAVKQLRVWLVTRGKELSDENKQYVEVLLESTALLTDGSKLHCVPFSWINEQSRPDDPDC